jgi:hypothetical protein
VVSDFVLFLDFFLSVSFFCISFPRSDIILTLQATGRRLRQGDHVLEVYVLGLEEAPDRHLLHLVRNVTAGIWYVFDCLGLVLPRYLLSDGI